jgi:drug/metabolite transporter (DMT)-like permease
MPTAFGLDEFLARYPGELAGLATAACWTVSSIAFTEAARRMGALALNGIRLAVAIGFFVLTGWALRGRPFPTDASAHQWAWLSLSGLVGFTFGDFCLFRSFVALGPRVAMVFMALVPALAAAIGWAALGERLSLAALGGIALTMAGVVWVIRERRSAGSGSAPRISIPALLVALGAAAGQAGGLVLSKIGLGDYDAFAATQIRAWAGLAGFAALFVALRAWPGVLAAARNPAGMGFMTVGTVFGPFLGVALSLLAIRNAAVGVASALMSVAPVLMIPFAVWFYRETVTVGAVLGTLLAVGGVAVLFLVS